MKKIVVMFLAVMLLFCMTACGEKKVDETGSLQSDESEAEVSESVPDSESESTEPETSEEPGELEESEESVEPEEESQESVPEEEVTVVAPEVDVLNFQKSSGLNYQWDDATMVALSKYTAVSMWYDDAEAYPELAQFVEQRATMVKKSMEEEYDNLLVTAWEELGADPETFETYVSKLDIQVRRADSVAVSLLSDSWADYGWIEDFRGMYATNIDTATGEELLITDVIVDMDAIPGILVEELNSHLWAGMGYSEEVVADYFANTPVDGISWSLDYNGVTIYWADGDLEEPGNGRLSATIAFEKHPEIFSGKYMAVPESYMVELPLDHSFYTNLDEDPELEELQVAGWYDSVVDMYTQYGIYTDANGSFQYEEYHTDGFHPYYVKTADGNHYLYLFCEQNEGPFPQMNLVVYNITDGNVVRVGDCNMGPGYVPENTIRVPADPESLWLDDYSGMEQDAMEYVVGPDGMPEKKNME